MDWQKRLPNETFEVVESINYLSDQVTGSTISSNTIVEFVLPGNHTYLCYVVGDVSPARDHISGYSSISISVHGN